MRVGQLVSQTVNVGRFCLGATKPSAGPLAAHWDITDACNSRCAHCQRWQQPAGEELTTGEGRKLIADLAALGVRNLSFAGNEPLLRRDLVELVAHAKDAGLVTSLNTNGLILRGDGARDLAGAGLDMVYLSLDGSTAETNDRLRGVPGAFEKTLAAVEAFKAARAGGGLRIMLNFVVNRLNVEELPAAVGLAADIGVDGMLIQPVHQVKTYFECSADLAFRGEDELRKLRKQLEAVKESPLLPVSPEYFDNFPTFFSRPDSLRRYRCAAAYATVDVRANGDVVPCPVGFAVLGNVRERPLRDIWYGEEADAVRRRIKEGQHPICWFACVMPVSIVLSNLSHLRLDRLLHLRLIQHIWRKMS